MEITIGRAFLNTALADANNSVLVSIGDNETGDTEGAYAQMFQQYGFCSLPPNAITGMSAAECVLIRGISNRDIIINTRDVTSQALYANMNPGDVILYAAGPNRTGPARIKMNGTDNSLTLMTTDDGTVTGNMVALRLSPDGLSFISPFFNITIDKTGAHLVQVDGASLHLTPSQDPTTGGNAVMIAGGTVTINSGSINLGPETGLYLPAAVSILPVAVPGVPLLGEGVGAVLLDLIASPVVNISGIAS